MPKPKLNDHDRQRALYYLAGCAQQCARDVRNDVRFMLACAELQKELRKRGDAIVRPCHKCIYKKGSVVCQTCESKPKPKKRVFVTREMKQMRAGHA